MQTDELRAELAELAREVDPFDGDVAAIQGRVARRRVVLGSIATVVVIALLATVMTVTRSSPSRIRVVSSVKEVAIAELPRLDAVVVLPANATSADAARVQAILDQTAAVERYAQLPTRTLALVLRWSTSAKLRTRVCTAASTRSYAVELDRAVHDTLPMLKAALGDLATVPSMFWRQAVDVEVFMEMTATATQIAGVKARIASDPDVVKYSFISRQAALREFKSLFADEPVLVENTKASSLPESFRLQVREGVSLATVANRFQGLPGVDQTIARSNELWAHPESTAPPDKVEIFMDVRASDSEILAVKDSLIADAAVESFRFLSQEDAYNEFKTLFADEPALIEGTNASALPASFRVTLKNPDSAPAFDRRYRNLAGVQGTNSSGDAPADACAPNPVTP